MLHSITIYKLISCVDEVDLKGHRKTFGSSRDFTNPKDVTSWCVKKWEEAGAVILGKLNMHELGLGTTVFRSIAITATSEMLCTY